MEDRSQRKRVLQPIPGRDGNKTYWMKLGSAFVNKDGSINVYLDALPIQNKLQIRDWDEERREQQPLRVPSPSLEQSANDTPF